MIWQSVIVILLGCNLAGNTFTSAVSPIARKRLEIADGEELLRALEFLDRYEGERGGDDIDNLINDDYPMVDDDNGFLPYDPLLTQDRLTGNGLPQIPPYILGDYPLEDDYPADPYDLLYNTDIEYPMVDDRSLTIGERMNRNWEIRQVVNRLLEDAVLEEMLREDAAAAADLLEMVDDMEEEREDDGEGEEDGFVDYGQAPDISDGEFDEGTGSDVDMSSFVLDDDYSNQGPPVALDSFADYGSSVEEDDDGVDEGLIEAVILKLAEGQMREKLLEEEGVEDEADLGIGADDGTDEKTEAEIDNFVAQVMSELLDGSEALADKLVAEIEEEKDTLTEEDTLDQGEEGEDAIENVVFGDGWDKPEQKRNQEEYDSDNDSSCPALDIILDDCMVVDEFPGLGDGGYKEGFVEECNRHQLCYFCSGTFGIPYNLCDETYKMELMTTCGDDDECGFRAKYFWLSALASRDPTPVDVNVCREPCVVAYLLDNN